MKIIHLRHFKLALLSGLVFISTFARAATYSLPAGIGTAPFNACSFSSGTTYNCSTNVSLANDSIVNLTSSITLNISLGGFVAGNNVTINSNGLTFLIQSTEDVDIGSNFTGGVSIQATGKTININPNANITGNLTAGTLNIGNNSTVIGTCIPSNANCTPVPVADWRMDETVAYSGVAGEVNSSVSGGTNGTARRSANNLPLTAAFPGNISGKLCGGVEFNGVNYLEVAGLSSQLSGTASLSFWVNTTQVGTNSSWTSPGVTGVEQGGGVNDIFWGWINPTGKMAVNKGNTLGAQSTSSINTGTWRHIVLTRNQVTGETKIYVDGVLESTRNSETGLVTTVFSSLGRMLNASNLNGKLDEVKVFAPVLSNTQVASIYANESAGKNWDGSARVCPASGPHHLEILHSSGAGLTCASSTLTVRACADNACSAMYTGGVSGTLTATGTPTVNWDGTTGGATGANFVIPAGSSSVTKNVQVTTVGSVVFGQTTPTTPAASNVTTCNFGSPSCTFTASAAGFIFDVPNHVSEVLQIINVSAVKISDNSLACTPAFSTISKNLTFKCSYSNPVTGTLPVRVNGAALNATNNTAAACDTGGRAVSLAFNASGVASTSFQYADVGNMSLTATYTGSGADAGLSMIGSDTFIAAPKDFAFSGITAAPIKAGNNFSATVTARNNANNATPNFGKETATETAALNFVKYQPTGAGAVNGSFSGTLGAFSGGAATGSNLNWSEVGTIDLNATLTSGNYLGSGLTAIGSTGSTGTVGRFIPDHFDTVVTQGCSAGGFTYSAQPFTMQITARNFSGGKTLNYDGSFNTTPNFAKSTTLSDANAVAGGSLAPSSIFPTSYTAAVATASPAFNFASAKTAPATIKLRATDTDSVTSSTTEGTADIRSGRLRLQNVYGSELLALPVPLEAQYWNGLSYIRNQSDSCTVVPVSSITMGNYRINLSGSPACETQLGYSSGTGTFINGVSKFLRLTKPGVGNNGSVDLTLNLNSASGNSCNAASPSAATAAGISWFGTNPVSRATFGIYKTPIIYFRENF